MANNYNKYVPDEGPEHARILFVGEAPGETEHEQGRPFIGASGDLLVNCLSRAGVQRDEVRLSNLCHFRPFNNKFEQLLHSAELKAGIAQLYDYIGRVKPTVIAPLGAWPLAFLTGKKGIKNWRGSILSYIHDENIKCIPTYHPAAVLRERSIYPTFDLDIRRIISDAEFREKRLPIRRFITDPRGLDLEEWTQRLCDSEYLAVDIETVKSSSHILCVGFASEPSTGVCIVAGSPEGRSAITRILESPAKKIFQFGSFDTAQLKNNGYTINDPAAAELGRMYYWDTYIAQHVIAPELPRSLEYLTSIYTREPYYKTVGRGTIPDDSKGWSLKTAENKEALWEYNCRDVCTDIEIFLHQKIEIETDNNFKSIFDFEMSMLEVAGHISDSGMLIDQERRQLLETVLMRKWAQKQFVLDRLAGYEINVRSPALAKVLYDKLKLPVRRNRNGGVTTDEDAIVSLITFCRDKINGLKREDAILDWKVKLAICQTVLEIRGIRQVLANYLRARISDDGRIRSTYKVGGTETGRWSASGYVDGTGINSQTLPRDPVEVPDEALTMDGDNVILEEQLSTPDEEQESDEEAA